MTRTVADAALMLQALAGYDEADLPSADVPVPDFAAALWMESSSLRLGIPRSFFYEGLDPEIDRAVNEALMVLARLTAGVREVELPSRPDVSVYRAVTTAEATPITAPTWRPSRSSTNRRSAEDPDRRRREHLRLHRGPPSGGSGPP
jgi:Asp-tRNA(Asn)/Glu-tRNA(Gln) amidotransferase A subunit family amidase